MVQRHGRASLLLLSNMLMATAKKVVEKVKEVVKRSVTKRKAEPKVEISTPVACVHCNGTGLLDRVTICSTCCGSGLN